MQQLAHLVIDNQFILLLMRSTSFGVKLCLRASQTGELGQHLEDEELHLLANPNLLKSLLQGATIEV